MYHAGRYRHRPLPARREVSEKYREEHFAHLLFVLGLSIGSNRLIVENLGRVGWQAAILAVLSLAGSIVAARIVFQLFFEKGEEK